MKNDLQLGEDKLGALPDPGAVGATRKFVANARLSYLAKFVGLLALPLVFILARTLGPGGWGLFSLTLSILTFLRIAGGSGLGPSTGKHLAALRADEEESKVGPLLASGLLSQVMAVSLLAVAVWLTAPVLAVRFGNGALGPTLRIGAVALVFFAVCEFSKAALQGIQRFDYIGWVTGAEYGVKLIFAGGLALLGYGVAGALWGFTIGLIVAGVVTVILFLRLGMRLSLISRPEWRSLLSYSIPLIATTMGFVVYAELDNLMIGYYMGVAAVGVYAVAIFVARGIPELAKPIGQAAAPIVVKLVRDDPGQAARLTERLLKYVFMTFLAIATAIFVLAPKILALVGRGYAGGAPTLRVMAVFVLSLSLGVAIQPIIDYAGLAWRRALWLTVSVGANVVLNLLLIPRIGGLGAALATAVTHAPYVLNNVWALCKLVGLKPGLVYKDMARALTAGVAAGAVGLLTLARFDSVVVTLLLGATTYLTVILSLGIFSKAEFMEVIGSIRMRTEEAVAGVEE